MASRNITLRFGELINIPMRKESAVESKRSMANLCAGQPGHDAHEPTPVKAPATCETCGLITDRTVLLKGVKEGRSYAVIDQTEVNEAKEAYSKEYKDVLSLVPHPAGQIGAQTAPGDSLHYLTPADATTENQYRTLADLIGGHQELAFVGLHTPVSATDLYQVQVRDGILVMQKRVRAQALKPAPSVGGEPLAKLRAFLDMELDDVVAEFAPDAYEDRYQVAVGQMLARAERVVTDVAKRLSVPSSGISDADLMEKLALLKGVA